MAKTQNKKILLSLGIISLIAILVGYGVVNIIALRKKTVWQEKKIVELRDSIETFYDDIYSIIDYVEQLELKKQPILTTIISDTVVLASSGQRVDTLYTLPFSKIERAQGAILKVDGETSFKWDFLNNEPLEESITFNSFDIRLNVSTKVIPVKEGFEINVTPLTPSIEISDNRNSIVDEKTFLQRIPSKVSLGIHAGYGLMYDGVQPYVGVGITYNFIEINSLLKKK